MGRAPEPLASTVKLIELDLDGGLQQPQLQEQLLSHSRGFGKFKKRRKEVRQIQIKRSQGGYEALDRGRVGVREFQLLTELPVQLLPQSFPIELHKRMFFGHLADHLVSDPCTHSEPRQVDLLHFSAAAHVVHQKERFPFAANESHNLTPELRSLV